MKKNLLLLTVALMFSVTLFAQKTSVSGVSSVKMKNLSPIVENNEVKGYFFFYMTDKASKDKSNYGLLLYNNNFEETHKLNFVMSSKSSLLEGSYNGNHFCFSFLDAKAKTLEYRIFDLDGKEAGTYKISDLSSNEMNWYASMTQSDEDEFSGGIMPVPNEGFVRYGMEKEGGYRVSLEYFDNTGKKQWTTKPFSEEKKSYETAEPVFANNDVVISAINVRKKALNMKDMETSLIAHKISDGTEKFKFPLENDKGFLVHMGVNYDEVNKQYITYGEYYGKTGKDKFDAKNKIGFYLQVYDDNGKLVKESFSSWEKDMIAILPVNKKGKMDNNAYIFIHNVVKTADGNYYAIGEQFKKAVSGTGVAMNLVAGALGGRSDASNIEIQMMDMMVFEFNSDLKPLKADIIEKEKSKVLLPKGYGVVSIHKLGFIMKMAGYFDYAFTTESVDKSTFNAVYVNYDKDKKEKTNFAIGSIGYSKGKEIEVKKIKLNTKPTYYKIMPAKTGYLAIFEYDRKEKTANFRLEKLE